MKNYIVMARVELEANSPQEAEDMVLGMEVFSLEGIPLDEVFVAIEDVEEV